MFLKSLSMKGFKSFADPTVLEFEPGITVVVGPNGSGKSNVVDAVTWVLGAQGPRSLRSQKMEDVIFAGTSSRPALGRSEVSLTIDNSLGRLPVEMAEVTITRTLFRSGESEYAINGTPCRLLDIQDLLSDSGVGRQQHMIIGQGQLDTVLNARPEDRRAIIEEAAGVLKHRRRRERAERRLDVTQENLERLGDLVREVRRQIRPLERQAAAARSHSTLSEELHALRVYLAGKELTDLERRRQIAAANKATLAADEGELQRALAELDEAASTTAAELSSRREEDLASALGRVQGLVERTRGTAGVIRERSRALAAALDAAADIDVVSTLEAESARLVSDIAATEADLSALEPEGEQLRVAESALPDDSADPDAAAGPAALTEARPSAAGALSDARSRLQLLRQAAAQGDDVAAALDQRLAALTARASSLSSAGRALAGRATALEQEGLSLAETATRAHREASEADGAERLAQQEADRAQQERHRTAGRAEALARALKELQGLGGRELLDGVDGVVGSLVDLVDIDPGWEPAFEAAAGAAVAAVVVEGRAAAHEALARLQRQGVTGAVLAARATAERPSLVPDVLPAGAERLRHHVRSRSTLVPGLDGVLDALVGRSVRVAGWDEAIDLSLDRPELVVVTSEGDRFASSGWRVRSGQAVVTAAAVDEADRQATVAARTAEESTRRLAAARATHEMARQAAIDAQRAVDRNESARAAGAVESVRLSSELEAVGAEVRGVEERRREVTERITASAEAAAELEGELPELQLAAEAELRRAHEVAAEQRALDARRAELGARRSDLQVRVTTLQERRRVLGDRSAEVERRLKGHAEERQQAAVRRRRLEAEGRALERLGGMVEAERLRLDGAMEVLSRDYRSQVEAVRAGGERLESLRRDRASNERRLDALRDRSRAADLEAAEVSLRIDGLVDMVGRELGGELDEVRDAPLPEVPEGTDPATHAASLSSRLAALGPVNPLALEELSTLEERHRELDSQVSDIRAARRELQEVVRTLDAEIMESFATAAADVNEHFSALVNTLFPGGTGRMVLTEPEDLLHTGVEVEVRPAGRNVRRVSLLSGGERSLAALAFLFAVFRSRPSPFYLMDEVEAALDDVNLHRFLGLVREFRDEAQLIIVSHQKRTMETGDALYGVTMAPGGSSQVLSQRVRRDSEVTTA